ncbi:SIMPL domain-containing protein, partial [Marinospirillum sp.]|uniref:SIMPL domain-containing protein n=1 Tax=Marinospirillum sp. TaxID=2183934 RepID=UPI00287072CD
MKNLFALGLTLSLLLASAASASDWAPQPHLKVAGEASITLDADRVDIHASFTSDHKNSRLALQELESRFGNLLRSLRRQLPENARLEAGQVRVHPRHKRSNDEWQIIGYTATRDLIVLDLPVEKTGEWV